LFHIRQKIKFYSKHFSLLEKPIPSKKKVPLWYKKMKGYPHGKVMSGSVKKCVPFLDALTSGYFLVNNFEIFITWREQDVLDIRYNQNLEKEEAYKLGSGIKDHLPWQINDDFYNDNEIKHALKFDNPWRIETPKGYSCMFLNPPNNPSNFRIMEGIVDTDKYKMNVNLPFVLKNFNEEVSIPAGQPLVWVVPFKRESWKMEIHNYDLEPKDYYINFFKQFLDNYKNNIWSKKEYD